METLEAPSSVESQEASAMDALGAVLAGLSEEQREVLTLRFVDGLSLGEVAEMTFVNKVSLIAGGEPGLIS